MQEQSDKNKTNTCRTSSLELHPPSLESLQNKVIFFTGTRKYYIGVGVGVGVYVGVGSGTGVGVLVGSGVEVGVGIVVAIGIGVE